jgi:hypothetical protein
MPQSALFEQIFSDAHLVDIDLSAWDKLIALYVLADHAGRTADNRMPLFFVEFLRVRSLDIRFNHLGGDPPLKLGPHEHVQWWIDQFRVEPVDGGLQIALWGFSSSPRMALVCEAVNIPEMPLEIPYRLFPTWSKPGSGFIRPGLDALSRER